MPYAGLPDGQSRAYAWAQTCEQECLRECANTTPKLTGKERGDCIQHCRSENCHTCAPRQSQLFPRYYVLGLVYAPPGCTSTGTEACSASSVEYQASSTMGTRLSTAKTFKTDVNLKVDLGLKVEHVADFGVGASGGYTTTSEDSNSQTISKGQSLTITANGNRDGIDHDQDQFILLLNPAVALQRDAQAAGTGCAPTGIVNWYVGLNSQIGGSQMRYTIPVKWLKDPSSMNREAPTVARQLQSLGFTNSDYQTILHLDPFWNGSTTVDPQRFAATTFSFPYEPTAGAGICISMGSSITNSFQAELETSSSVDYSVGFSEQVSGIDFGFFSLGASSNQNFTWTSTSSKSNTTDSSQTATVTVACPSRTYTGQTLMSVYWDKLFGSFMFLPTGVGPDMTTLAQGNVATQTRHLAAHQLVELKFGGKIYHTFTDARGDYVFLSRTNVHHPATGQLSIQGVTQTVTLKSPEKLTIHLPER
jgi:hypothetical protein